MWNESFRAGEDRERYAKYAFRYVSDHLAKEIEEQWMHGRVAVLVHDIGNSFYFIDCDENGWPKDHYFETIHFPSLARPALSELTEASFAEVREFKTTTIRIVSPAIRFPFSVNSYSINSRDSVFCWNGEMMSTEYIPIEKLDIKQLMKVAHTAIEKRDGLVIDLATRNKLIK